MNVSHVWGAGGVAVRGPSPVERRARPRVGRAGDAWSDRRRAFALQPAAAEGVVPASRAKPAYQPHGRRAKVLMVVAALAAGLGVPAALLALFDAFASPPVAEAAARPVRAVGPAD